MRRAVAVLFAGVVLIAVGFARSPWPWAAAVAPGVLCVALGVVALFRMEVE